MAVGCWQSDWEGKMEATPEVPEKKKLSPVMIAIIAVVVLCIVCVCCVLIVPTVLSLLGPSVGNVFSDVLTQMVTPTP
jgi:hypothetical protein